MTFVLSVVASLVAGVILLVLGGLSSRRVREALTAVLGRLVRSDVQLVFASPREAEGDLRKELGRTKHLRVLTGRGNEFQRETFAGVLGAAGTSRARDVRILLPCTEHEPATVDWVADREAEVAVFDRAYGAGTLTAQIRTTAAFLTALPPEANVTVRRYDLPHLGRIVVTDHSAYLTPYRSDAHSRDSSVVKYRRDGEMYDFLARLFDKAWAAAHPEPGER